MKSFLSYLLMIQNELFLNITRQQNYAATEGLNWENVTGTQPGYNKEWHFQNVQQKTFKIPPPVSLSKINENLLSKIVLPKYWGLAFLELRQKIHVLQLARQFSVIYYHCYKEKFICFSFQLVVFHTIKNSVNINLRLTLYILETSKLCCVLDRLHNY